MSATRSQRASARAAASAHPLGRIDRAILRHRQRDASRSNVTLLKPAALDAGMIGVRQIRSFIVLKQVMSTTQIPL